MEDHFWFYSTVAQVFAAIWAVTGMFALNKVNRISISISFNDDPHFVEFL